MPPATFSADAPACSLARSDLQLFIIYSSLLLSRVAGPPSNPTHATPRSGGKRTRLDCTDPPSRGGAHTLEPTLFRSGGGGTATRGVKTRRSCQKKRGRSIFTGAATLPPLPFSPRAKASLSLLNGGGKGWVGCLHCSFTPTSHPALTSV